VAVGTVVARGAQVVQVRGHDACTGHS
jgi:hypothetical protein